MRPPTIVVALLCACSLTGCYAGSQFALDAPRLEQPVSMTQAIHNADMKVLTPAEYDELGTFSLSFSGWSIGWPLSSNPRIDISDALNTVVKGKGGNGITRLTIHAANNPFNFVSMFLKGVSWLGIGVGIALFANDHPDKLDATIVTMSSAAVILLLPVAGDFTVEGTVVRFKQRSSQ